MGNKKYKFSRYAMYKRIQEFFDEYELPVGRCLLVGDTLRGHGGEIGNTTLTEMLPKGCKISAPSYPDVDMQNMPYEDNTFDYVLADMVIEHVQKPWVGVEESRRVLKVGGIAIFTSALLHPIHGIPNDYWRFTPDGLKILCENFSEVYQCEGMGDLKLVIDCLSGRAGKQVVPGTEIEKRALAKDGKNMSQVWIIVGK